MSGNVTLSSSAQSTLLTLQNTAQMLQQTQQRLATGKKVNSAIDNPTSFFSAQSLTQKAGDLSGLLDGMSQGIRSLNAANQGITSAQSLLQQMQSVATSAASSIQASNASTSAGLHTISNSTSGMSSLVTNLTSTASPPVATGIAVGDSFAIKSSAAGAAAVTVTINQGETMQQLGQAISAASNGEVSMSVDATGKFSLTNSSTTHTYGFAGVTNDPILKIFGATNGAVLETSATTGLGTSSSVAGDNSLNANSVVAATSSTKLYNTAALATIAANNTNLVDTNGTKAALASGNTLLITLGSGANAENHTITVSANGGADGGAATVGDLVSQINSISGVSANLDSSGKLSITATGGQALKLTGANFGALGLTVGQTINPNSAAPNSTWATQFDSLRTQLDQLVGNSGYQGQNLISGSGNSPLKILFDTSTNSSLQVNAMDLTSTGLGIGTTSGNWNSASDVAATQAALTAATSTLRTSASVLGTNLATVQTRQTFSNNMITTLNGGAGDLTNADMNAESANMLTLQTQNSLATSALSMAMQAQQSILKLFP